MTREHRHDRSQILFGVGLTLVLAVGSQVLARRLPIPALIVLLPVGFVAGALTDDINPAPRHPSASTLDVLAERVMAALRQRALYVRRAGTACGPNFVSGGGELSPETQSPPHLRACLGG